MKKLMMICITAAVMMAPLAAYARPGGVYVAPAFGWGWSSPYWGPYPYPYGYYDYAPATGAVKFDTNVKDAEIYIDGAYAGTVGTENHAAPAGQLRHRGARTGTHAI
jgi:hypothetical protein